MSTLEPNAESPIPSDLEVVAAFLDGEAVDAAALKQALAADESRQYFVDLIVLRHSIARMGPTTPVQVPRRRARTIRRALAAAIVVLIAGAGGYVAGERAAAAEAPPPGASSSVEAVVDVAPPRAPKPTHVIRLEAGVNWHAEGGD